MSDEKRVDEDWKRRAQMEKELDAQKAGDAPPAPAGGPAKGEAPSRPAGGGARRRRPGEVDFLTLVEQLASQALLFMGAIRDPMTGQSHENLPQAQMAIDLLEVLEEKTKGNLSPDEEASLQQILDEVRMTFVRLQAPPPPPKGPMMGNRPPRA
jgi:hypothetical protein